MRDDPGRAGLAVLAGRVQLGAACRAGAAGDRERDTARSPARRLFRSAPSPASTTSPMNSWPVMSPLCVAGTYPSYGRRPEPQIAAGVIFTIASRRLSIVGSGTFPTRTVSGFTWHLAFMSAPPRVPCRTGDGRDAAGTPAGRVSRPAPSERTAPPASSTCLNRHGSPSGCCAGPHRSSARPPRRACRPASSSAAARALRCPAARALA